MFTTVRCLLAIGLLAFDCALAEELHPGDHLDGGGVSITTLSKTSNSTGGTGQVAAAGTLAPFGGIGVGCGINWNSEQSYGGGIQAGTKEFGLGGGANITADTLFYGAGIGVVPANATVNLSLNATTQGKIGFKFDSSKKFACTSSLENGIYSIDCSTV